MEDQNQVYLAFPLLEPDEPLFIEAHTQKFQSPQSQFFPEDISGQPMDQLLLKKMSALHQSLRNKKLRDFELLQVQIMKKDNYLQSESCLLEILQIKETKERLKIHNFKQKKIMDKLKRQLQDQRRTNATLLRQIEETNKKIVKNQQQLSTKQKKNNLQEYGYVSVQKFKLQAENLSKDQFVSEIKSLVGELKYNISRKQTQKEQLEEEYHQLLKAIEKEQKLKKEKQKQQQITKRQHQTYRFHSGPSQSMHDKENNPNQMNIVVCDENEQIERKQKENKMNKRISSATAISKRTKIGANVKQNVETGKKTLPRKIF